MRLPSSSVDPRLRVAFMLGCGFGAFAIPRGVPVVVALVVLSAMWLTVGLPPRRLVRQFAKLWLFTLLVAGSYALFDDEPKTDVWRAVSLPMGVTLKLNLSGLVHGLDMVGRLLVVVLASQIARAGDARAIAQGLLRLRVPMVVGLSLDAVLELLGDEGGGGGGGGGRGRGGGGGGRGGGGGGRGGGRGGGGGGGFRHAVRRDHDVAIGADGAQDAGEGDAVAPRGGPVGGRLALVRALRGLVSGDVVPLVSGLDRRIERAEAHTRAAFEGTGDSERALRRDVAVVAGVSATMLALKAVKLLPSIPFAPGYKLVVLTPLYIVAATLTHSRFGATLCGLTMGTVAFLMGDGRYGPFEILKHLAPGLICDMLLPWMTRDGRAPGRASLALLGAATGVGRVVTVFVVMIALSPPALAYAGLVPNLIFQVTFGALSGYVSEHVVRLIRGRSVVRSSESEGHQHPIEPEVES